MKEVIFIVGGVRSGKSAYAQKMAKNLSNKVTFFATAIAFDAEMKERIAAHKRKRPSGWKTVEEPKELAKALLGEAETGEVFLIDCLGLFVNNLLLDGLSEKDNAEEFIEAVKKVPQTVIVVSNEVGQGIVPADALSRRFRDQLGVLNQKMAVCADKVIFMRCGIPQFIKGGKVSE